MADVYGVKGYNGSGWDIDVGESNKIAFCGAAFGNSLSVGAFQDSSHKSNSDMSVDGCATNHMRNCKYISPTEVKLMDGSPVTLNTGNVAQTDCTTRFSYQDDGQNTVLSNIGFFAYDGSNPANGPTGVLVTAFERTASAINKDRLSDTPGAGGAWDSSKGIGGSANALICSGQASASIHNFYLGISAKPTSKGLKTAFAFRLEFDAQ